MTTYNTGNPVPSADARDRYDNSQTLDEVVNGDSASYTTRTGKQVISLGGMNSRFNNAQDEREAEFNLSQEEKKEAFQSFLEGTGWSSIGAYGAGVVITSHTQTVDYLGQPYSLKPSIPASLDAPYVTTGTWATEGVNFKLVGDNSLRQGLASPIGPSMLYFGGATLRQYIADAGDLGLTTLNAIIKYAADNNVPVQGRGTYPLTTETINLAGKRVVLNLENATVVRNAAAVLTLSAPAGLKMNMGIMRDNIALATRMIEVFGGSGLEFSCRSGVTDGTLLYASGVDGARAVGIGAFTAFTQPVVSADQGRPFEFKSCAKVVAFDISYKKCGTGFKIEAVSTGSTDDVIIGNINGDDTYDTSLFLRLVATAGTFRRLVLSNVLINKAGKAGIKFSADSAVGLVLRQAILSNVIVTGYAHNVSSPGISSFRDASTLGVTIGEVEFSNVIVDGYALDGTIGSTTGDCSGISFRYLNHAILNGVITRNTLNQGINLLNVTKVSGAGNIVTGAGITVVDPSATAANSALASGVNLSNVMQGTLQVDSHNNAGSGFYLDRTKWMRLSGVITGNARYGLETKSAGAAETQTTGNTYSFTGTSNSLGFAAYSERNSDGVSSEEVGCIDDFGPRSRGTTARRDAMSAVAFWPAGMFVGRTFYNTTTAKLQTYSGSVWSDV